MFAIGQEIIAIRDHVKGKFKKGETFIVKSTEQSPCSCHAFLVDVGIKSKALNTPNCSDCNRQFYFPDNRHWFSNRHFAPVVKNFAELVIKSLEKEKIEEEILIN